MAKQLDTKWVVAIEESLRNWQPINETLTDRLTLQFLILRLLKDGRPFKVYTLGAGGKRITTDTETCPCCNKKL